MRQFGSGRSIVSQNQSAVTDSNGNLIVSPDDTFGSSPLGLAALQQAMIGVPNGTFNILPPDVMEDISTANPLPYWDVVIEGGITTNLYWDENTQTWALQINTIDSAAGDTAIIRTRIPIINDDGLLIRHYLSSTLLAVIRPSVTPRWTLTLTAQYYDTTGAAIGTPYTIGSIDENNTSTTVIDGFTNASGAIDASAAVLEIVYTMDVTANNAVYDALIKTVTVATQYGAISSSGGGGIPETIIDAKGDLIVGSAPDTAVRLPVGTDDQQLYAWSGASSGVVWDAAVREYSETFETSGTWTRPTGVNYVTVIAIGAGGGGGGGAAAAGVSGTGTDTNTAGGAGGGSGGWIIVRNIYVGDVSSVSVGIGSGGTGGAGATATKAAGVSAVVFTNGTAGSAGGSTTFGSYLTVGGGAGGTGGLANNTAATQPAGGAGGTITNATFGASQFLGALGGNGSSGTSSGGDGGSTAANNFGVRLWDRFPYTTETFGTGSAGGAGSTTIPAGGTSYIGVAGTAGLEGFFGSGGGGGGGSHTTVRDAGDGNNGGGGGGAAAVSRVGATSGAAVATGGSGGASATTRIGGGGGGGGAALGYTSAGSSVRNASSFNSTGGTGGNGRSAKLVVIYVY